MDCNPSRSSVHGISQARILEWVAISPDRGSCWPRDWTCLSCIGFFTAETPGKPLNATWTSLNKWFFNFFSISNNVISIVGKKWDPKLRLTGLDCSEKFVHDYHWVSKFTGKYYNTCRVTQGLEESLHRVCVCGRLTAATLSICHTSLCLFLSHSCCCIFVHFGKRQETHFLL